MGHRGFLKILIIIFIGLVILAYFGVDVRKHAEAPWVAATIGWIVDTTFYIWTNFLKAPTVYVWNEVVLGVIWPTISSHLPGNSASTTPPSI